MKSRLSRVLPKPVSADLRHEAHLASALALRLLCDRSEAGYPPNTRDLSSVAVDGVL